MFEVLAIGDGEMMYNAFQGVAMIVGADGFDSLARSGFMLGLLAVVVKYLTSGRVELYTVLSTLIIYLILFAPKVTVSIEDIRTNEVRAVANIPIGLAAPMSIVSRIGYELSQLYETAMRLPDGARLTETGYMDALTTLLKLRGVTPGGANSDATVAGDLSMSLTAYIDRCVAFDLELPYGPHEVTRESLRKATDLWAAMKTTFINRDILVYLPDSPNGQQLNCRDAYNAIDGYLGSGEFQDLWDATLRGRLGLPDTLSSYDKVTDALVALGQSGVDAQTFMRNALIASYLQDGPAALVTRPAGDQLNIQWAGEQSLFEQYVRPLTSFIETFAVAVTPLIAFLVALGPYGMGLGVKYLQLMAWIATWGPTLAITNMFLTVTMTRVFSRLAAAAAHGGAEVQAMLLHDRLFLELEHWVAVGGAMAAATPALSLMLIYGGSVVATSIAGRLNSGISGAVGANVGRVAPAPTQVAPALEVNPQHSYQRETGLLRHGATPPSFSWSGLGESAVSSTRTNLQGATAQVSQSHSNLLNTIQTTGHTSRTGSSVTELASSSASEFDRRVASGARQVTDRAGLNESERRTVDDALTTAGGLGLPIPAVKASVESALRASGTVDAGRIKEKSDEITNSWNNETGGGSELRKARDVASMSGQESIFSNQSVRQSGEQYLASLGRVRTAQEQYQEAAAFKESAGITQNLSYPNLADALLDSGAHNDLSLKDRDIRQSGDPTQIQRWERRLEDADHEISASGYTPTRIGERLALKQFLALRSLDPAGAVNIAQQRLLPASAAPGTTELAPEAHQSLDRRPDEIYDPAGAGAAARKAGETRDILGTSGGGGGAAGPARAAERPSQEDERPGRAGGTPVRTAPPATSDRGEASARPRPGMQTGSGARLGPADAQMRDYQAAKAQFEAQWAARQAQPGPDQARPAAPVAARGPAQPAPGSSQPDGKFQKIGGLGEPDEMRKTIEGKDLGRSVRERVDSGLFKDVYNTEDNALYEADKAAGSPVHKTVDELKKLPGIKDLPPIRDFGKIDGEDVYKKR